MSAGEGLSTKERAALETLPLPGWKADRVFFGRGLMVSHSSTWRKSSKHWDALIDLEARNIVERKISRGETLWRLTKPLGLEIAVRLSAPAPTAPSAAVALPGSINDRAAADAGQVAAREGKGGAS